MFVTKQKPETFLASLVDPEIYDVSLTQKKLTDWLSRLDPNRLVRLTFSVNEASGEIRKKLEVSFEQRKMWSLWPHLDKNREAPRVPWGELTPTESRALDLKSYAVAPSYLDSGEEALGCVRLVKPHAKNLYQNSLQEALELIPKPFSFMISIQRLSPAESQIILAKKLKQSKSDSSSLGSALTRAAESAQESTMLEGEALFRVEVIVTLSRKSSEHLRRDLSQARLSVSRMGDAKIETFGALPSILASQVGSAQHVFFFETATELPKYLPIFAQQEISAPLASALKINRDDESISHINILAKEHLNSNAIVVGASGRGKSALIGMLTESLLRDESAFIIKVDVGGSHSKECELLAGAEHEISLSKPSGIDPFLLFQEGVTDEGARAILGNFLSVLILEKNEASVSKSDRAKIDDSICKYLESKKRPYQFSEFIHFAKDFPRHDLLKRWAQGGLYGNAFLATRAQVESRLSYYNFSSIFEAADPEFAQAGMAAVLLQFNSMMRLHPEKRIILICDETPFFIERCFEFFKFTSANVRKFGAAFIPVVQQSKHLIVSGDTTLIDNSFHKFLLSVDGDEAEFQVRMKIDDSKLKIIKSLRTIPAEFSEFFYGFGDSGILARLRLTNEEYLRVTTTKSEKMKIQRLLETVPGLQLQEAIKCLSL